MYKNLKFQVWDLGGQTSIRYTILKSNLDFLYTLSVKQISDQLMKYYIFEKIIFTALRRWVGCVSPQKNMKLGVGSFPCNIVEVCSWRLFLGHIGDATIQILTLLFM